MRISNWETSCATLIYSKSLFDKTAQAYENGDDSWCLKCKPAETAILKLKHNKGLGMQVITFNVDTFSIAFCIEHVF